MTRLTSTQKRERGKLGEAKLSNWLDRCVLPYLYIEQSPLTVPSPKWTERGCCSPKLNLRRSL